MLLSKFKVKIILIDLPETNFQGYVKSELDTNIDLIIQNDNIVNSLSKGDKAEIISHETIFYEVAKSFYFG